jgi:putative hydrolase of the HAD superfamily
MIGDQLDRDIVPAMEADFLTIYFPGGFQPNWLDKYNGINPNHKINTYSEVPEILSQYI